MSTSTDLSLRDETATPNFTSASLDDLALAARTENANAERQLVGVMAHYLRLGEILLEVRNRIQGAEWTAWWEGVGLRGSTVSWCMRLAFYRDQLPAEVWECRLQADGRISNPSLRATIPYLRGLPAINPSGQQTDHEVKAEAVRLRKAGVKCGEIAKILGVNQSTVSRWTGGSPAVLAAYRRRNAEREAIRLKEKRAAAAALKAQRKREERDQLAKASGNEISEAYSLIRRALAALDKAVGATEGSVRSHARTAMGRVHCAEDDIVLAMRAERQESCK